jgi:hypothetical protein
MTPHRSIVPASFRIVPGTPLGFGSTHRSIVPSPLGGNDRWERYPRRPERVFGETIVPAHHMALEVSP